MTVFFLGIGERLACARTRLKRSWVKAIERFAQMNVTSVKIACSFIKKKRYRLRVKQYWPPPYLPTLFAQSALPRARDKAEDKTSRVGLICVLTKSPERRQEVFNQFRVSFCNMFLRVQLLPRLHLYTSL